MLCKILGGQDNRVLADCIAANLFPQLVTMAKYQDVLPALSVRCNEQLADPLPVAHSESQLLTQALRENTLRNMQISVQALKLTKQLNKAGITPLFLKGTVQLLAASNTILGFRKQVDIDLLVEPEHIEAAAEVFQSSGYGFYDYYPPPPAKPVLLPDTSTAIRVSTNHHHLPSLVKADSVAIVELHRHYLPKRFQRKNPLEPLLSTAVTRKSHGATFREPSLDYQLIHLILGKLVHDGHLVRRTFPLREACDLIHLLDNAQGRLNAELIAQHCGDSFSVFRALVEELMGYATQMRPTTQYDVSNRLWLMRKRYNSPALRKTLNNYARALHLANSLAYNPAKLAGYTQKLFAK